MNSDLFKLKLKDFVDGLVSAVIVAIIVGLKSIVMDSNFSLYNADWVTIGNQIVQWSSAAFLGYVGNVFISDKQGRVLGIGEAPRA